MTTGPAPASSDTILRRSVSGGGDTRETVDGQGPSRFSVTLDRRFQGLPDTAHGGTVLALFDAIAGGTGPRLVSGVYRRRVPLATPLQLAVARRADATMFALTDGAAVLVDGRVAVGSGGAESAESAGGGAGGVVESASSLKQSVLAVRIAEGRGGSTTPPAPPRVPAADTALPLPISRTCFACGTENPLGLRVRLAIDDASVRGAWTARENFRGADGNVASIAITTLLDEAAFWLGAAASGESGMTTDLRVKLYRAAPLGHTITVAGARASVRAHRDDPRYWDTDVAAWSEDGALVASATITFVAVRGAARKLVAGLLAVNPPEVIRTIFPAYAR
jgi:acyl-coenzyme A thioesterase PaaI-like protein